MSNARNKSLYVVIVFIVMVFSVIITLGFVQMASAEGREFGHREFMDSRHGHNHVYLARGHYVERLPGGYRAVVYGRSRYFFHEGVWYRPYGSRFVVVVPPFGLIVPFLPPYYTTIWVSGIPYYYANDIYYTQTAGGYIVVEPPKGEVNPAPPPSDQTSASQIFIYPRQGQSEKKQADDRYDCHRWAVSQTGYDPTKPPANLSEAQMIQKRADYQRASAACLDGRGYTVK
ncbi:MAG: DUF6515 family protein [Smithellaceae bacterium]